jgi:hypothetical protein
MPSGTFYDAIGSLLISDNPPIIKFNPDGKKNMACYYLKVRKDEAQLSIQKDFNLVGADTIPHQIRMAHTEQLMKYLETMLKSIPEPILYTESVLNNRRNNETKSIKIFEIESSLFFTNCLSYHDPYGKVAIDKWVQLKKEIDAIETKKTQLVEEIRTNIISIFRSKAFGMVPDEMYTKDYLELLTNFVIDLAAGKIPSIEDLRSLKDGILRNHIGVRSRMSYLYNNGKFGEIWICVSEDCSDHLKWELQEKHLLVQKRISDQGFVSKWKSIPCMYNQASDTRALVVDAIRHLMEMPVVQKICPLLQKSLSV